MSEDNIDAPSHFYVLDWCGLVCVVGTSVTLIVLSKAPAFPAPIGFHPSLLVMRRAKIHLSFAAIPCELFELPAALLAFHCEDWKIK